MRTPGRGGTAHVKHQLRRFKRRLGSDVLRLCNVHRGLVYELGVEPATKGPANANLLASVICTPILLARHGGAGRVKQHHVRSRTHCQFACRQAQRLGRAGTQACQ